MIMKNTIQVQNRKAGFDIEVQEKYEAGLILSGDEIKSIRAGRVQLSGSYVKIMRGKKNAAPQPIVIGLSLSQAVEPDRSKPLLLHAKEIETISRALETKGKVAVPLVLYISHGWAKVTIGVGTGRKNYDKRQVLKKRDVERSQRQDLKGIGRA